MHLKASINKAPNVQETCLLTYIHFHFLGMKLQTFSQFDAYAKVLPFDQIRLQRLTNSLPLQLQVFITFIQVLLL